MIDDVPLFEVTTAEADVTKRRLVTAAEVRTIIGSPAANDSILETYIDAFSRYAAERCGLAGVAPTFAREVVKATWYARWDCRRRGDILLLPWRTPVTVVGQVVEDGVDLSVDTDYVLRHGGLLQRLCEDRPTCWSSAKIVVPYTAGWVLPAGAPADLKWAATEQVKTNYLARTRDSTLRSESVPDVYQASYGVVGGDSFGDSGLLKQVEAVLDGYKSWPV